MSHCHLGVAILAAAASAALFVPSGRTTKAAPAPAEKKSVAGGVVVLDDSDPDYEGKATYDDGLNFFSAAGKLRTRASGLNVCQEVGSPNRIVIDAARKQVWVAETVGHRLLRYDLDGREQLALRDVKASALAVDPATGNVWVAAGDDRIDVYAPAGKRLASHKVSAYDLAYDARSKAIWAVEKKLDKLSLAGKVLVETDAADWIAVSVAVNGRTGDVWTVSRCYSKDLGKNALLGFDNDGALLHTIPLADELIPFRVTVNPRDGSVWVVNFGKSLLHYDAKGKRIAEHKLAARTAAVKPGSDNVWVVTEGEILEVDEKGKVVRRSGLRAKTSQAWIAAY